jgi:Arm DNA-binding domain
LQVSATGAKSWIFRFKRDGKARDMGLGSFPAVSLSEARQKARGAREHRDAGKETLQRPRNGAQTHARQPSGNAPSS